MAKYLAVPHGKRMDTPMPFWDELAVEYDPGLTFQELAREVLNHARHNQIPDIEADMITGFWLLTPCQMDFIYTVWEVAQAKDQRAIDAIERAIYALAFVTHNKNMVADPEATIACLEGNFGDVDVVFQVRRPVRGGRKYGHRVMLHHG